jgi:HAD superfamily hydrolase (TIGR01509 family)
MIQALILDMDGVLFDTERLALKLQPQAAAAYGFSLPRELLFSTLGRTMAAGKVILTEALGPDFPHDQVMAHWKQLMFADMEENGIPLKPGAKELLKALAFRGIPAALATSNNEGIVAHYLALAGLEAAFAQVVCGDQVPRGKPAPDIYLAAARALGVPPGACMGVEDSPNGLKAVRGAGMVSVMVPDLLPFEPALAPYVDHCVPSLGDILPIIA